MGKTGDGNNVGKRGTTLTGREEERLGVRNKVETTLKTTAKTITKR